MVGDHSAQGAGVRVGVVIVNYNSGDWLRRCIEHLAAQTRAPDRVVVVDNASSDRSLAEARPVMDPLGYEVINSDTNLGFAVANNVAVDQLHDVQWVALLNPDALADPAWLDELMNAAQRQDGFSFFGSRMVREDDRQRLDGIGDVYHASGLVWRHGHGKSLEHEREIDPDGEIFSPCAAAALYRRDQFLDAGGFDSRYFCYSEDVDLGFRLRLLGHRCRYVPTSSVAHAGSGITGAHSEFTVYHGHRNLTWTFVKNMPGRLFWMYLPQHLLMSVVTVVWMTLRGRGRAVLRAKRDAILGLRWAFAERRRLQASRTAAVNDIRAVLSRNPLKPYLSRHG